MNNYPPGAANDPNAPYNQEEIPEIGVNVKEVLDWGKRQRGARQGDLHPVVWRAL